MAHAIRYTVTRSLSGLVGHDLNDVITMSVSLKQLRRRGQFQGNRVDSLSGVRFTTHHRADALWTARTVPKFGDDVLIMVEFLDSAMDQIFAFDPYNAAGTSPDDFRNVVMESKNWEQFRVVKRGGTNPHLTDGFEFSWTMREL